MKKQENMFQTKEQNTSPETNHTKIEVKDFPNKEFVVMVIKLLTELTIAKLRKKWEFQQRDKNMKITKQIIELKNTISGLKNQ